MTEYMEPLPGHYDASDPFMRSPGAIRQHRGSDYNGVPAGTWFHIAASGEVVINQWSSVLGWVLGVRNDDGLYMGYAHLLGPSPHPVGNWVTISEGGGAVGNTGSASNGNHLHISLGYTRGAIFGEEPLIDPAAWIFEHMTTSAGDGEPIPLPEPTIPEEDNEMAIKFGHRSNGDNEWMIVHPQLGHGGYLVTTDQDRAIAWSRLYKDGWVDEGDRYDFNVPRDQYIQIQDAAREAADVWRLMSYTVTPTA